MAVFSVTGHLKTLKMTATKPQSMLREASRQVIAGGSAGKSNHGLTFNDF